MKKAAELENKNNSEFLSRLMKLNIPAEKHI